MHVIRIGWGAGLVALSIGGGGCRDGVSDLHTMLEEARTTNESPGALLGIRLPDGRTLFAAAGLADRETGRAMDVSDAFFLGSVSKIYTAAVALRLVEEGLLALDEPLKHYLPLFPRGDEVTVRHLLGHTSGLKDFYSYLYFRPDRDEMIALVTKDWTQDELLDLSARFGYWFDPGSDWSYSSTNYFLLGVLIERATGLALPEAYRTYIFAPLGLEHTWLTWHEPGPLPLSVTGYMGPVTAWEHSQMFGDLGATTLLDRSPAEWGAGGLATSAEDALQFFDALMAGRLLTSSSLELMTEFRDTPPLGMPEPNAPEAHEPDGYGLGLIRMERPGFSLIGHGGAFTGHTAGLWHVPNCGVTIALYFNRGLVGQRSALDRTLAWIKEITNGVGNCGTSGENGGSPQTSEPVRSFRDQTGAQELTVIPAIHQDDGSVSFRLDVPARPHAPDSIRELEAPPRDSARLAEMFANRDMFGNTEVTFTVPAPSVPTDSVYYLVHAGGIALMPLDSVKGTARVVFGRTATILDIGYWAYGFASTATGEPVGGGFMWLGSVEDEFDREPSHATADDLLGPHGEDYEGRGTVFWKMVSQFALSTLDGRSYVFVQWAADTALIEAGCVYRFSLFQRQPTVLQIGWVNYGCDV